MPPTTTKPPKSAVPTVYYIIFGVIEPLITFSSLLEAIFDSEKVCVSAEIAKRKLRPTQILDRYGRQPSGSTEASEVLARTAYTVVCQMVVAHAVIGLVNASVLRTIRSLPSPTLQEKIARSLLIPLAVGDVMHQLGTFYGMGDLRWRMNDWPEILWLNAVFGIALFVPRCARSARIPRGGD